MNVVGDFKLDLIVKTYVAQPETLLACAAFLDRVLLLIGPDFTDSDLLFSVWPRKSEAATLFLSVVWWSGRKSLLAPSLTSFSLWLEDCIVAWCAVVSIRTGCCELFGLLLNILCCNCQSKNEVKYDETNNETFILQMV